MDDGKIRKSLCQLSQARQQQRVEFDRVNGGARRGEVLGHFAVARADFNPAIGFLLCRRRILGR